MRIKEWRKNRTTEQRAEDCIKKRTQVSKPAETASRGSLFGISVLCYKTGKELRARGPAGQTLGGHKFAETEWGLGRNPRVKILLGDRRGKSRRAVEGSLNVSQISPAVSWYYKSGEIGCGGKGRADAGIPRTLQRIIGRKNGFSHLKGSKASEG